MASRQRSTTKEWIPDRRNYGPVFLIPAPVCRLFQVINNFRPPMPLGNRVLRECGSFWAGSPAMPHRDHPVPGEKRRERSDPAALSTIMVDHGATATTRRAMVAKLASPFNLHSVSWTFLAGRTKCLLCLSRISGMVVGRREDEGQEKIFYGQTGGWRLKDTSC